ncbi:MAG: EamA family transporter [Armatimonas sp.]
MNWATYAFLSAVFAGMTALLAKIGIEGVPSNVATMVRTIVIVIFAIGIVLARGEGHFLRELNGKTWLFLVLSGIATGLSWLCYFAALKLGPISHVAPIDKLSFVLAVALGALFLHEKVSRTTFVGIVLIVVGVLLTLPSVQETLHKTIARKAANKTTAPE